MSCQACEDFQESGDRSYPYRWGAADVLLLACEQHAREIFDVLRAHQRTTSAPYDIEIPDFVNRTSMGW